ncbi:MAG: DUF5668 domain-containing protein [Bacteroidales bacterium]|nr:DUF5668 domain-containing protein [Bacteroidales bacterium]
MASKTEKKVEWEITVSPGLFGYVLIFLGIVFFLQNFGWLVFSWSDFWRLWPLLLVFCGIAVIPMKNWLKQIFAIFCGIGALFILLKTPNFDDGYVQYPKGRTELKVCEEICEKSKDKDIAVAPAETKPVAPPPPAARPARPEVPPPPIAVDSTLILDVSLLNLDPNDGLRDRSVFRRTMFGGISGVSVYPEGGLILNRRGGAVPKWEFGRRVENVIVEFEVKLLSRPRGHGRTVAFVLEPELNDLWSINITSRAYNEMQVFFDDIRIEPTIPLNVWTKIRVEVEPQVNGEANVKLYQDGKLRISGKTNYFNHYLRRTSNQTFSHISLGADFGFAYHDRADAALRNLRVWVMK